MIPLVLGFTKEDQKLKVVMFENMIESAEKPITKALITLSNSNLEVYSAQIRLDAHFRGLRYFMYYHSIPTAITFMLMFLTWEMLFSIIAWRSFVSWWQRKVIADSLASPVTPITPGGTKVVNNITEYNYQDDNSDRAASRRSERAERTLDDNDNGTTTESESEYESSRPVSVISPTGTALVSESGEMSYNTESYATDVTDDESNSVISRPNFDDDEAVSESNDDQIDDDDGQTEGSATPTTRSRKSTISEASTTNKSEAEGAPSTSSATLTSRLQSDYTKPTKPYVKKASSRGSNDDSDRE